VSLTNGCPRWKAVSKQPTWVAPGERLLRGADAREVVRLVQRREGDQRLEPSQRGLVQHLRFGEIEPAVHDPVADGRDRFAGEMRLQRGENGGDGGAVMASVAGRQAILGQG
jgi:hypothetical protein